MSHSPSHRFIRALLACCPIGERRDEITGDVIEVYDSRRQTRGRVYATLRLLGDVISLVLPLPRKPEHNLIADGRSGGTGGFVMDLRYGLRLFRKHPAVIGATVSGLALAIAICTTVFTLLNASILRGYGMDDPATVNDVQMLFKNGSATSWPYHAFAGLRERATRAQVEAFISGGVRLGATSTDTPGKVDPILVVSGGYMPMLGGRTVHGRALQPRDDEAGAPPVAVINHKIWRTRFSADPYIVGRTVWVSGAPITIVGVVDPSFTGPIEKPPVLWVPFGSYGAIYKDRPVDRTSSMYVQLIARTKANEDPELATRELSTIAAGLPDVSMRNSAGGAEPVTGVQLISAASPMSGPDGTSTLAVVSVMVIVVGLVLALACMNVANLLLAGAAARAREISVRLALGASRRRIVRQLLSESVLLGLIASAVGLLLSLWLVPFVAALTAMPETYDISPDRTVFLFAAAVGILAGLGAGLSPARHGSRGDLNDVLKSQSTTTSGPPKGARLRRWFIGFQAAGSIILLVTAALFLRGALTITRVDFGFDSEKLAVVSVGFPRTTTQAAVTAFWIPAMEQVRTISWIEHASLVLYTPLGDSLEIRSVDRGDGRDYNLFENRTDAAYFRTAGFQLVKGRGYTDDEVRSGAPVAVVSESIVRDFYAGVDPIGASLKAVAPSLAPISIVGVVREAITARLHTRGGGTIYQPLKPVDIPAARLMIRAQYPSTVTRRVETTLMHLDPQVSAHSSLVSDDVEKHKNGPRIVAGLSSGIAMLALALSLLGVFGVTTFVVSQRMWEVQVRRAIGASSGDIVRMLARQSLTPVLIGLVAGLALTLAGVRVLAPALSGVSPYDPAAIIGALSILLIAATAAVLTPAIKAARANPANVLKSS